MTRRRLSTSARVALFEAAGGRCHICGGRIAVGDAWDADHVIPLAMGGEDGGDNLAPAHRACHRGAGSKTSEDVAAIAKAKRVRAKHLGAAAAPRATLPGSKASRWKRTIDGRTVRRNDDA